MFLTIYSFFHQKKTATTFVTASQIVSVVLLQGVGQKSWMNVGIPYIPVTILMKRYILFCHLVFLVESSHKVIVY